MFFRKTVNCPIFTNGGAYIYPASKWPPSPISRTLIAGEGVYIHYNQDKISASSKHKTGSADDNYPPSE